jgi:S-adenosylmethionine hydrolase
VSAGVPWRRRIFHLHQALLLLGALAATSVQRLSAQHEAAAAPPTIVFMTDFGTANDAAAICRAVMVGIVPGVRIMDITHQVTPFSIEEAARNLEAVTPYYPEGTVFLVVVDPGVGTDRKALIVRSRRGQFFVLPDNGIVTPVIDRDGLDGAREITNPVWMIGDRISSTFHGRDIFSPTAAYLASGWEWTEAGPPVTDLVRLAPRVATVGKSGVSGEVIALDDPYGNLITDITEEQFRGLGYRLGDQVAVQIEARRLRMPFVRTFADVPVGKPLLYIDSRGRVAFSLNERDMARAYGIRPPVTVRIPRRPTGGAAR